MRCKFGHVTLGYPGQRNPRIPLCGRYFLLNHSRTLSMPMSSLCGCQCGSPWFIPTSLISDDEPPQPLMAWIALSGPLSQIDEAERARRRMSQEGVLDAVLPGRLPTRAAMAHKVYLCPSYVGLLIKFNGRLICTEVPGLKTKHEAPRLCRTKLEGATPLPNRG